MAMIAAGLTAAPLRCCLFRMRKLDAVLPLLAKDYERSEILQESLAKNFKDLNRCWVIVSRQDFAGLSERFSPPFEVVSQNELLPQLSFYWGLKDVLDGKLGWPFRRWRSKGRLCMGGWYLQQLIKLAIAERITTDFYLTLDADLVCLRPTFYGDLIVDGRAVVNTGSHNDFPEWYVDAERILGCQSSGLSYGVTPSVLHRDAVLALQKHIGRRHFGRWTGALMRNTPWTEYTLYHTFLEATHRWHELHFDGGPTAVYDSAASLWWRDEDWSVEDAVARNAPFMVVQSNTGIPVSEVRKRLEAAALL